MLLMTSIMKTYSTKQAATLAGIHSVTLYRWMSAGKVRASQAIPLNGTKLWRWTQADVEKIRKYKAAHYWEGRGVKKKGKA